MQTFKKLPEDAQELWFKLGTIPVNDGGEIQQPFENFPIGTDREEIWHWFEETYNISARELMFHKTTVPDKRQYFTPIIQNWINDLFTARARTNDTDDELVAHMVKRGIKESIAIELVSGERHKFELSHDGSSKIDFRDYEPEDDRIFSATDMFSFAYGIALMYGEAVRREGGIIQGKSLDEYIRIRLDDEMGDDSAETWTPYKAFPTESNFTEGD